MDSLTLVAETFAPLAGRRILDIGCGAGHLARALAERGARVTGIDTSAALVAAARALAPDASFEVAPAENMPFADASFAGVVLLNSLHHVEPAAMAGALAEAARVTEPGGPVVVIEPLTQGSFFAAFRPIEDETQVRAEAQSAIARAVESGRLSRTASVVYSRPETFLHFDQFVERATAADPSRLAVIGRDRVAIEAAFSAAAERDSRGLYLLDQPLRADILAAPAS